MLDLLLTISRSDKGMGYRVALQRYGDGATLAVAHVPLIDRARWRAEYLDPLARFVEEPFSHERQVAWGKELAALLLPPPVRAALEAELSHHALTTPLRLRLLITPSDLADVPWEFVYVEGWRVVETTPHPERGLTETPAPTRETSRLPSGFLCLQPHVHLVRQSPIAPPASHPLPLDTLRVLLVWADPRSAAYPALSGLASEVRSVLSALRAPECRHVEVDELRNATPSAVQRRLREQPPHVLHFVGHGDVRASGGVLVLEGAQPGAEEIVYADELARWLSGTPVRVVVLSACRTGASVRSVGATLAAQGVPCVVAMQLPLRDVTAGHFARAFYSALVASASVEDAVSEGRQAVRGAGADWGVPVLYLASTHSDLFAPREVEPPPTNLPYRANPYFVGRENALAELRRLLHTSPRTPVALVGMGGIGKTQLAVEYAHAHAADYPGGIFYLNAENTSALEHDYAALGGFFDVPATLPTHERAMLVRDRLYRLRQPSLLILDNLTEDTHLALPPGGLCHILLTTRKGYLARRSGCLLLNVRELDEDAALSLLQIRRSADNETGAAAARAIARKVGFHPLMLTLIANYVGQVRISLATYLQDYLAVSRFAFIDPTVNDILDRTHRELRPFAQRVLATAACFAGQGIACDLLQSACDLPSRRDFMDALAELDDFSL
ncbi:MAG: CHAT domain-containing protein, partial [Abditibacteriales bacterium]|nr:CHAT domain-containing protein [Abditibacteriales bacterium]